MARNPSPALPIDPAAIVAGRRQHVYNGELGGDAVPPASPRVRSNRKVKRRAQSPLALLALLLLVSLLIVFYIWNKISVNHLTQEVNELRNQYERIAGANEILRAEINQKSQLERISKIATEKLKLTDPKEQPVWFEVDAAHTERLRRN